MPPTISGLNKTSCATSEDSGQSAQLKILIKNSLIVFNFDSRAVQSEIKCATATEAGNGEMSAVLLLYFSDFCNIFLSAL